MKLIISIASMSFLLHSCGHNGLRTESSGETIIDPLENVGIGGFGPKTIIEGGNDKRLVYLCKKLKLAKDKGELAFPENKTRTIFIDGNEYRLYPNIKNGVLIGVYLKTGWESNISYDLSMNEFQYWDESRNLRINLE